MAWWKAFCEQVCEAWQQLLYSLELACSGGDDLPWLDTLNFTWDSLPDADKLTTAEKRRLAHSMKQRVRDSVSKHYAHELSHKAAIRRRQAAATAQLAEQHVQKLADARQRQMEELCSQSRQQSMRLPSIAELLELDGQLLLPQQGGGQPWPLLQQPQQAQQQRASSSHFAQRWQQQKQPGRSAAAVVQPGKRGVRGSARSSSVASSSRLERVLSGDETAEDAAAGASRCSGDVVLHIPAGYSSSSSNEIEPLALQQQQQQHRVASLRCIVTSADSGVCELQQPLLLPVVESPFAAAAQQIQQQPTLWDIEQPQQQQDGRYQPPSVLVLAAAKLQQLQQQQQQQQQQQAPVVSAMPTSSSSSDKRTFSFQQHTAAAAIEQPTPGTASQLLQGPASQAAAGEQSCIQHSGSQMLLQRYLDGISPAPQVQSAAPEAAQPPAAAAEGGTQRQQQHATAFQQQGHHKPFCGGVAESQPPSECTTAVSSPTDHCSSCCGGCQPDSLCKASESPPAAALKATAPAAVAAAAGVAAL